MPIYDFYCSNCRRRSSHFFRTISAASEAVPICPHCQSENLRRLVSKVAVVRSEEARLEAMSDPSMFAGLDEEDPRALGRMMRQMSSELGEEMDDPEFNEVIDRLESGQSPEDIEASMPGLAEGAEGGGFGGGGFDDF
ncbi:MAG: zinc ribbon domain-containing protein [Caldilineales bacterium]|nr:zinc ribbon domain-containing protein [Caldilineales bacterium]